MIYYLLGILSTFIPLFLLLYFGPTPTKKRIVYILTGFGFAVAVGLVLYLVKLNQRFDSPDSFLPLLARVSFAAVMEETIRYPAIIIAQLLGSKLINNKEKIILKEEWTEIKDPHGLGLYFGVGWGYAETFGFYIIPAIKDYYNNVPFEFTPNFVSVIYRITAVMAHVSFTYIALIITVNRAFYRVTIGLHLSVNIITTTFIFIEPNGFATILVTIFTRFSLVIIMFYLHTPKARYYSPALLFLILVLLFLGFILIGTLAILLSWIISEGGKLISR